MKRWTMALCAVLTAAALSGCSAEEAPKAAAAPAPAAEKEETVMQDREEARMIRVRDEAGHAVLFTLEDNSAADSLYRQLPLTTAVRDYSTNEKIFYPQALDISNAPHPPMELGTLAYYAPWGNVVLFFGKYNANSDLYELGHVSAGMDEIARLTGTITVEAAEG